MEFVNISFLRISLFNSEDGRTFQAFYDRVILIESNRKHPKKQSWCWRKACQRITSTLLTTISITLLKVTDWDPGFSRWIRQWMNINLSASNIAKDCASNTRNKQTVFVGWVRTILLNNVLVLILQTRFVPHIRYAIYCYASCSAEAKDFFFFTPAFKYLVLVFYPSIKQHQDELRKQRNLNKPVTLYIWGQCSHEELMSNY